MGTLEKEMSLDMGLKWHGYTEYVLRTKASILCSLGNLCVNVCCKCV